VQRAVTAVLEVCSLAGRTSPGATGLVESPRRSTRSVSRPAANRATTEGWRPQPSSRTRSMLAFRVQVDAAHCFGKAGLRVAAARCGLLAAVSDVSKRSPGRARRSVAEYWQANPTCRKRTAAVTDGPPIPDRRTGPAHQRQQLSTAQPERHLLRTRGPRSSDGRRLSSRVAIVGSSARRAVDRPGSRASRSTHPTVGPTLCVVGGAQNGVIPDGPALGLHWRTGSDWSCTDPDVATWRSRRPTGKPALHLVGEQDAAPCTG
jgi:hypothetical protein